MDGLDTPLARLLHLRARVPLAALEELLRAARADRPDGPALAARLVTQGYLTAADAEDLVVELHAALAATALEPRLRPIEDDWEPGLVVAGHRVVRRLGQGGMGTVYEAEQLETGARRALKTLPLTSDPELLLRFQREAELLARVGGHPHVVQVHAVAREQGRVVLVMDLLGGGDLARRLDAGPLPAREVVSLGAKLARGLAHLHAHGVLHRDLKPHNVVYDDQGEPRLCDFGLASLLGADSLTATGEVLGTPAYMAPEQARGDRGAMGPWTDVYGLGAVLFHAATGAPPFTGRSFLEVLARVCAGPPPSTRERRPDLPQALEGVIWRALATRPEDRPPSATALEAELLARARVEPVVWRGRLAVATLLVVVAMLALALASAAPEVVRGRRREAAREALRRATAWDDDAVALWAFGLGPSPPPDATALGQIVADLAAAKGALDGDEAATAERVWHRLTALEAHATGRRGGGVGPTGELLRALQEPDVEKAAGLLRAIGERPPEWAAVRADVALRALSDLAGSTTALRAAATLEGLPAVPLDERVAEVLARRKDQALSKLVDPWVDVHAAWIKRGDRGELPKTRALASLLREAPAVRGKVEAFLDDVRDRSLARMNGGPAGPASDVPARGLALDAWLRSLVGATLDRSSWREGPGRDVTLHAPGSPDTFRALALGGPTVGTVLRDLERLPANALEPLLPDAPTSRAARAAALFRRGEPLFRQEALGREQGIQLVQLACACLDAPTDDLEERFLMKVRSDLLRALVSLSPADWPPGAAERARAVVRDQRAALQECRDLTEEERFSDVLVHELELVATLEGPAAVIGVVADMESFLDQPPPGHDHWPRLAAHARYCLAHALTNHEGGRAPERGRLCELGLALADRAVAAGLLEADARWQARSLALRFLRNLDRGDEALARLRETDSSNWQTREFFVQAAKTLRATDPAEALKAVQDARGRGLDKGDKQRELETLEEQLKREVEARRRP